ncbi:hypothetical protein GCM10027612_48810 [Microbispora bryophytorum subsp. camponoti]
MPQAAQPRHGDTAAGTHAQRVQGFPDGDAGAEQGSGGRRVQTRGKRVGEPVADDVLAGETPRVVDPSCRSVPP